MACLNLSLTSRLLFLFRIFGFKVLRKEQLTVGEGAFMNYGFHLVCFVIQGPGYQT